MSDTASGIVERPGLDEQETALNMYATDRTSWTVYTNDLVMQGKMERIGAELVAEHNGGGKSYNLRADQLLFRKGKRHVSEKQRAASADRLRRMRAASSGTQG